MSHIKLGSYNVLRVVKTVDFGLYLDGGEDGEILLPTRYVPQGTETGDLLRVFIYLDQDERLVATTLEPYVQVGEFAWLEVAWVNQYGAFLNWGLMKDLFVPFAEQKQKMEKGKRYLVHVHVDEESYRIMASAKVERYLSKELPAWEAGEEVDLLVCRQTDLGYQVIANHRYAGLIYRNEIYRPVEIGKHYTGYVKQIRPDGKIDFALQRNGQQPVGDFANVLLDYLSEQGGQIGLHDKTDAEIIYETFGVSKKVFKKAVGDLYKKRLILITEQGISLVE